MNHNKARKIRMAKRVAQARFKANPNFVLLTADGISYIRKYLHRSYRSKVTTRTKFVVLGRDKDQDFILGHVAFNGHSAKSANTNIPKKYKGHCLYVIPAHIQK